MAKVVAEIEIILLGIATISVLFTETVPHIRAITCIASLGFSGLIWAVLSIEEKK